MNFDANRAQKILLYNFEFQFLLCLHIMIFFFNLKVLNTLWSWFDDLVKKKF